MRVYLHSSTSVCQQNVFQPVRCHPINCLRTYYICIYLADKLLCLHRGFCCCYAHIFLAAILCMSNFHLPPSPSADATREVGELNTPNNKEKVLPHLCKTVWEDDKMRKHANGGGWECLWRGFHKITDNHTKDIYHVAKVKIIGVNVYLCVANIPDS